MKKVLLGIGVAAIALVATSCNSMQTVTFITDKGEISYKVPGKMEYDSSDKKYVGKDGAVVDGWYDTDTDIAEAIDECYDSYVAVTNPDYLFTLVKESKTKINGMEAIYRLYTITDDNDKVFQYWGLAFYDAGDEQYALDIDMPYAEKNIKIIDKIVGSMEYTR